MFIYELSLFHSLFTNFLLVLAVGITSLVKYYKFQTLRLRYAQQQKYVDFEQNPKTNGTIYLPLMMSTCNNYNDYISLQRPPSPTEME